MFRRLCLCNGGARTAGKESLRNQEKLVSSLQRKRSNTLLSFRDLKEACRRRGLPVSHRVIQQHLSPPRKVTSRHRLPFSPAGLVLKTEISKTAKKKIPQFFYQRATFGRVRAIKSGHGED